MRPLPSAVGLLGFLKSITKRSRVRFYAGGLLSPPPRQQLHGCHATWQRWPSLTKTLTSGCVAGSSGSVRGVWRSEALLWPIIGNNDVVGRWQKDQKSSDLAYECDDLK
ncbi:hypothetical protein Tco_0788067 [Tanacetum coccineum]